MTTQYLNPSLFCCAVFPRAFKREYFAVKRRTLFCLRASWTSVCSSYVPNWISMLYARARERDCEVFVTSYSSDVIRHATGCSNVVCCERFHDRLKQHCRSSSSLSDHSTVHHIAVRHCPLGWRVRRQAGYGVSGGGWKWSVASTGKGGSMLL